MFKATLNLPVKLDVTLDEADVADAIEGMVRPFLPAEFRHLSMDQMISDVAGNVYSREAAGPGDPGPLPVIFRRDRGRAAMVDAYHTLKHRRLNHHGGDPTADLVDACKALLCEIDRSDTYRTPMQKGMSEVKAIKSAIAKLEGR